MANKAYGEELNPHQMLAQYKQRPGIETLSVNKALKERKNRQGKNEGDVHFSETFIK